MTKLTDFVEWKTVQGTAVSTPTHTLIPESQALIINFPYGGFVWQRPTAVLVQNGNQTERHPIVDITRLATWSIIGTGIILPLLLRLIKKQSS
ncbi:MAG: hypothetical protein KC433_25460 [Anaerolineales bacterium]|nr:hypothetical protein [Anaerolineales bacterium]MCB8938175.1 hypothetical protein [Ardenticatenaceae bacterium]